MEDLDPIKTYDPIERLKGSSVALDRTNLIASCQKVACIHTYAQSILKLDQFDQPCQMFEAISQTCALTRRRLKQNGNTYTCTGGKETTKSYCLTLQPNLFT